MSTETRDLLLFAVALIAVVASGYYYVAAVLDGDRPLSRAAAVGFFIFAVVAVVFFWRVL